jgi:hypothetical protein
VPVPSEGPCGTRKDTLNDDGPVDVTTTLYPHARAHESRQI